MTAQTGKIGDWYWHIHHEVIAEPLAEPLRNRIAYIKANKPQHEIEIRLRWLTLVRGPLPAALVQTYDAYNKARSAYDKAWDAAQAALERLHAKEHGRECPWDGRTLFP